MTPSWASIWHKFAINKQQLWHWFFNNDARCIYSLHKLGRYYMIITFNISWPRQHGRHFPDDTCECIFLNENVWISIKMSLKFVPIGPINNSPALIQIMTWHQSVDKPLSEPMMVNLLLEHICVTRPQWIKSYHDTFTDLSAHVCLSLEWGY